MKKKKMIPLTKEEKKSYKNQEKCHICEEKFCMDKDDKDYINRKKVKDHCHYTGTFRGAVHSKCNLNYKVPKDILIRFIHSFRFIRLLYQNLLITCLEFLIVLNVNHA